MGRDWPGEEEPPEEMRNVLFWSRRHLARTHLQAVGQGGELRPAVLAQALRLLLGLEVLGPGEAQRRGEEEAGLQAPVGWILGAQRRGDGGRGDGLGTLDKTNAFDCTTLHLFVTVRYKKKKKGNIK